MNINVAVDHSVVDGAMASEFVIKIKEYLKRLTCCLYDNSSKVL